MRNASSSFHLLTLLMITLLGACNNTAPDSLTTDTCTMQWKKLGALPARHMAQQSLPHPGLAGPVAGICNDYLIVGGGSNFPNGLPWEGGRKQYHHQLYVYRLANTADGDTALLQSTTAALPSPVGYPACVSTDAGIVVAGGENQTGMLNTVQLIKIDTTTVPTVHIKELPALPDACSGAMVAAMGTRVYLAGGNLKGGVTSDQFLLLDLSDTAKGWQRLAHLTKPTSFGVLYADAKGHTLYLAGGRKSNKQARTTFYASLFAFQTAKQTWTKKADLPYPVSAATGISLQDKLLLFGGDRGETFHQTEDLILKISRAKQASTKQALIQQKNNLQQHHPGFTHQILAYHPKEDSWILAGNLSFAPQVTTTAIPWGANKVIIACGEIRAGIRDPDIILGKITKTP